MRVLVYSPVRLFGDCVAAFLDSEEAISAIQTVHNALDLDLKALDFAADVVLVDVSASEALATARLVKMLRPAASAIAVAVAEGADKVIACADSGFDAYVPRSAGPAEMIDIIMRAHDGETLCDPRIARILFNELARRVAPPVARGAGSPLSPREVEVARFLGRGATNKEIAAELYLTVATVKNHVHSILHKLQVDSRAEVAQLLLANPQALRSS
jgi:DNA-binding NarL/FixJ family response regulator